MANKVTRTLTRIGALHPARRDQLARQAGELEIELENIRCAGEAVQKSILERLKFGDQLTLDRNLQKLHRVLEVAHGLVTEIERGPEWWRNEAHDL